MRQPAADAADRIHVAVAVVEDASGRLLIAKRPADSHQGGRWEFPGGKVEMGETVVQALRRELQEETGLDVAWHEALIRIPHDYTDKQVLLDVYRVRPVDERATGRQGQELRWVAPEALERYRFPAANQAILSAIRLPGTYVISPDPRESDDAAWWQGLEAAIAAGHRLFQYRGPSRPSSRARAQACVQRIQEAGGRCLINADPGLASEVGADGVHWPAHCLTGMPERAHGAGWLAASCHGPIELKRAVEAGVDFAVLGPVAPTASHPERAPVGWERFADWVAYHPTPVYALGGLSPQDCAAARRHRGQGVAGIRGFWPTTEQPD
jgi:8-oxo-dGTP diphosphatase